MKKRHLAVCSILFTFQSCFSAHLPIVHHSSNPLSEYCTFNGSLNSELDIRFPNATFHIPEKASNRLLKKFHTRQYVNSLSQNQQGSLCQNIGRMCLSTGALLGGSYILPVLANPVSLFVAALLSASALGLQKSKIYSQNLFNRLAMAATPVLALTPTGFLDEFLINPMKYSVGATNRALELALDPNGLGWAVNLRGGYTDATKDKGGNGCFYNDIAVAMANQLHHNPAFKCLIIDFTPTGAGNESLRQNYPDNVTVIDRKSISNHHQSNQPLLLLGKKLIVIDTNFNCVIVNDPGNLDLLLSQMVFQFAAQNFIPLVYVIAGNRFATKNDAPKVAISIQLLHACYGNNYRSRVNDAR